MKQPRVDIIISTYNAPELLEKCLEALGRNTIWPYNLIITDDCSEDPVMQLLLGKWKQGGLATVYLHKDRIGFAGNNARAVARTRAPYFVLLNQDTEPQYLWLTYMADMLRSDPGIGIVGARLLYSTHKNGHAVAGTIQHVGVARYPDGAPYHPFRGLKADYPAANKVREVNAVTGACMLMRRKCWDELGGFDQRYSMGQFEDCDLCWRARDKGWRIMVQPKAILFHYEHGCGEEHVKEGHDKNRELLLKEWGYLGSDEKEIFGIGEKR